MRFMVMMRHKEPGTTLSKPRKADFAAMGAFYEELTKAGVTSDWGGRLHPSSEAIRVRFAGDSPTVTDGPFAETKEMIAGYWLWQVNSKEEAVEWVKRWPNQSGSEFEIELRQVYDQPGT